VKRLREWIADDVDRLALKLWRISNVLRPPLDGPLCPDCRLAPDPGEDGYCETCEAAREQRAIEASIADGAYRDGFCAGLDAA
jgi:hypothetical protein